MAIGPTQLPAFTNLDARATGGLVSVVVPVYNEEESVAVLCHELIASLDELARPYEIIFVNDGSQDGTAAVLDELAVEHPLVETIHFRRNFGQTAALMAGIDRSRGNVIVSIDGDMQNDPADIPALIAKLEEGYDVVSGWRKRRHDHALTRTFPSQCANWLIGKVSGVKLHDFGCSLKAYRREVVDGVRLYGEMHRLVPIYAHLQGGAITEMIVNHRPRRFGKSKYGLSRIFKVLLDLLFIKFLASYSSKPMYVFGGFGLSCLAASTIPIALAFFYKFTPTVDWKKDFVETPLPVVAAVCILVGCLAILQGLLAEMLMRTYFESQGKRSYAIVSPSHPRPRSPK